MNAEGAQRYILYFSNQCPHSAVFRQMLVKKPDLEAKFHQLSVDSNIQLPSDVKSVPFIIVYDEKGRQLRLTDTQAFYWLRDQMDRMAGDFEAFDLGGMSTALSDSFSFIGADTAGTGSSLISGGGGLSHNYEFLEGHKADRQAAFMYTPKESEYGGGGGDKIPQNALERIIAQRNRDVPMDQRGTNAGNRPMNIDFSKPLPEVEREQRRLIEQMQKQRGLYTEAARRRDARIAAPRRGVDFGAPDFQAGLTQQIQSARQQFQQQQRQTPMERAYQQRLQEQQQMQNQYRPQPQQLPQGRTYQPVTQYNPVLSKDQYYDPRRASQPAPGHVRAPPQSRPQPQPQQQQPAPGQRMYRPQPQQLQQQRHAPQPQPQHFQRPAPSPQYRPQPQPGQRQAPLPQGRQYNPTAGRGRPMSGGGRGRPGVVAGRRLPAGWRR